MGRFINGLICVAVVVLVAVPALAEDAEAPPPGEPDEAPSILGLAEPHVPEMPETVDTGARRPENPFVSDRSLSVVDDRALSEAAPRATPEALWGAPGVFVQETNLGGGSPIVRGLVGPRVLILVDGVRLNNSTYRTGPTRYLNLIDPYSIARIEVLRGPGSVLYGSDAMGGVIQVYPLSPRGESAKDGFDGGGQVAGRYMSASDGRTLHGHADFAYDGQGVLGGYTHNRFENLAGGREVGEQPYSGYESWAAIGRLSFHVPMWRFDAGYLFSELPEVGRADRLADSKTLAFYDNRDHLAYIRLRGDVRSAFTEVDLRLSYQDFFERTDEWTVDDDLRTRLSATRDDVKASTLGADLQLETALFDGRLAFQYGGMWYHDRLGADRETIGDVPSDDSWLGTPDKPYPDGSIFDNFGGYARVEGIPFLSGPHRVRVGAGYRLHGVEARAPADDGMPSVEYDDLGHILSGSVRYLYEDHFTAALTYSQGFRAPNLQEVVHLGELDESFHIPNGDLEPETADTLELVARSRVRVLTFSAAVYYTRLDNLIFTEETTWNGREEIAGLPVVRSENSGDGVLWGIEEETRLDIGWGWSAAANLTYTWGEQTLPGGRVVPLSMVPPLYGQVSVRYDTINTKSWNAFVEVIGRGALRQDRLSPEDEAYPGIPSRGTPEWWTWNVHAGVLLWERFRLGVAVENLTGESYKYHGSGVYAPGTNAILNAEVTF